MGMDSTGAISFSQTLKDAVAFQWDVGNIGSSSKAEPQNKSQGKIFGGYQVTVKDDSDKAIKSSTLNQGDGENIFKRYMDNLKVSVVKANSSKNYFKRFAKSISSFFVRLCDPACSCFTTRSSQLEKTVHKTLKQRAFIDKLNIIKKEYQQFQETQSFDSALKIYDHLREMSAIFPDLDKKDNLQIHAQNIITCKFLFAKYLLDNFSQECSGLEDKKIESMRSDAATLHNVTRQAKEDILDKLRTVVNEIRWPVGFFDDYVVTTRSVPEEDDAEADLCINHHKLHTRLSTAYVSDGKLPDDCQEYKLLYNKEANVFYIDVDDKRNYSYMVLYPTFDSYGTISPNRHHMLTKSLKLTYLTTK